MIKIESSTWVSVRQASCKVVLSAAEPVQYQIKTSKKRQCLKVKVLFLMDYFMAKDIMLLFVHCTAG